MNTVRVRNLPPLLITLLLRAALALLALLPAVAGAQTELDTLTFTSFGDTVRFWAQIPAGYDPLHPPAILIWWHQLGGTQYELKNYTDFDSTANLRGWICASHFGNNDRHWNTWIAQAHCRAMLDWIRERFPFDLDSIYMIGGSMGGAAGQVWHNNNCGEHDYFIAATAGGSQILDTQLRQEQYLAGGDTNRSMRAAFGGLPAENDSVAFQYHRASAIHLADTGQSMHFNSLNLPVWSTWGNSSLEWEAYGAPAQTWSALRSADFADSTLFFPAEVNCHGLTCMWPFGVCDWLANFTANRYPDVLSINADENDEYYWTRVELTNLANTFARYGVVKRPLQDELDITIVRNVRRLFINATVMEFEGFDTLRGYWQAIDRDAGPPEIILTGMPAVLGVDGPPGFWIYHSLTRELHVELEQDGFYEIRVRVPLDAEEQVTELFPRTHTIAGAYPNPFNAQIELLIESSGGSTELLVYDLLGRLVKSQHASLHPGTNRVTFNAHDVGSGIFFVRVEGSEQVPIKIVLLR